MRLIKAISSAAQNAENEIRKIYTRYTATGTPLEASSWSIDTKGTGPAGVGRVARQATAKYQRRWVGSSSLS